MRPSSLSIRHKVTLVVCGLLLVGAVASSWMTYIELRRAALSDARDRLLDVTDQVAELLSASADELKDHAAGLAASPALASYLRSPDERSTSTLSAVLDTVVSGAASVTAVELWDADGRRLFVAGDSLPALGRAGPALLSQEMTGDDSTIVGPFRRVADTVLYAAAARVRSEEGDLGFVVERRRVTGSPESRQQIRSLIGSGVALYVGNRTNDVWTDLVSSATPPPVELSTASDTLLEYARSDGVPLVAAVGPVPGAPWVALVEFPRSPVVAGARAVAARLALLMTGLAILGMLAAWALSRRLMQPLADLADAAEAIARGDYSRRIDTVAGDELGDLAAAFNVMADQVREHHDRLEQQVEERTAELRAVNEELEAFSYSVSHDLRAPLRSIDGFCQALLEDAEDDLDDVGRSHLDRVRAASQRMARLIDDLLELSRVTRSEMRRQRVDLTALAREIVRDLTTDESDAGEIIVEPELEGIGDRRLLRVALENLLGNAWKFTRREPVRRITVGAEGGDDGRIFYVEDNGAGFDMTYADKLFTPFHRLHGESEFEGTGIGLATVQRIVHRHGGAVWAHAEVDRGATIRFTLGSATVGVDAARDDGRGHEGRGQAGSGGPGRALEGTEVLDG